MTRLFKNMPIRRKLIVMFMLVSVGGMLLQRGLFVSYEFIRFRQATMRQISTIGKMAAANSTAALAFENQEDAKAILAGLSAERYIVAACLYDKQGKLFATFSTNLPIEVFPARPGPRGYRFEGTLLTGFEPVVEGGNKQLGTLFLKFDARGLIVEWLRGSLGIAAAVMTLVLLVAYLLSRALQKQISEPILSLAETARTISDHGDYSIRATQLGEDETGQLTGAFNQMLGQIQAQDIALREKDEHLQVALQAAQNAEEEVRKANLELEQRVANRTEQLEEANKELASFSYSVSHDLRAPLRGIDGFSQALEEDYADKLDETGKGHLARVRAATRRMGDLIDDLLKLSHITRAEMHRLPVDLSAMALSIAGELEGREPQRQVSWEISEGLSAEGDPPLVRVALENLLGNAWKFTGKRPDARIQFGRLEHEGQPVFFVRDNGAGFDMVYEQKLFGAFQRLHGRTEFEGTGIGLATVQRIIHRHGGRVWAVGEVDKGATFYFIL